MAFDLFKHNEQHKKNNELRNIHQHHNCKWVMFASSSMYTRMEYQKIHGIGKNCSFYFPKLG